MLLWRDIQHNQEIISEMHRNAIRFFSYANMTIQTKLHITNVSSISPFGNIPRLIVSSLINPSISSHVKLLSKSQFLSKSPAISVKNNTCAALSSPAILPAHHGGILGSIDTIPIGAILATQNLLHTFAQNSSWSSWISWNIYTPPAVTMTLGMKSNDISLAHYGRIDFLGVVGGWRLILADILAGLLLLVFSFV